jgi:hypothetical protein
MDPESWCACFIDTRTASEHDWVLHRYPYASARAIQVTEELHGVLVSTSHMMRVLSGESPRVVTTHSTAMRCTVKSGLVDLIERAGVLFAAIYFGANAAALPDATMELCARRIIERLVARFGVVQMRLETWAPETAARRMLLDYDIAGVVEAIASSVRAVAGADAAPRSASGLRGAASSVRGGGRRLQRAGSASPSPSASADARASLPEGLSFALGETTYDGAAVLAMGANLSAAIDGDDQESIDAGGELLAALDEHISSLEMPGAAGQQTSSEYIPFGSCLLFGGSGAVAYRTMCASDARDVQQQCLRLGLCHASGRVAAPRIERMVLHLPLDSAGRRCSGADAACARTKRVVLLIASNG